MRSKTVIRLAILIAVLAVIGGTGFFVQRMQLKRLARSVVEQADRAKEEGDLAKAELLLKGHLQNVPGDRDIQLKYANLILEIARTPARQEDALGIYRAILKDDTGNTVVRRQSMDLQFEMRQYPGAREDLRILLGPEPLENKDGDLQFLMGRCCEEAGEAANAEKYYQAAIAHNASQRLEAYQRRAVLLRERLSKPDAADAVIKAMVESDPKNYQVYLERGRYRRRFEVRGAGDDLQRALELVPAKDRVEVHLEIAKVVEKEQGRDAARKLLEKEQKNTPDSVKLNEAIALLELRAGQVDKAIELLRSNLKASPNLVWQRWILARILAQRGDNGGLANEIEELRRFGCSPILVRFLMAYYNINQNETATARQLLIDIQPEVAGYPELKAEVNVLLARCYLQLGDLEMQREIYLKILRDDPGNLQARLGSIALLIKQGETDRAIDEYEKLIGKVPQIRLPLARLLIARNQQRPAANRDWSKVDRLIAEAAAEAPESAEPIIALAALRLAQGRAAEAESLLGKARSRYPKTVEIWITEISLITSQGRIEEARKLLEQAEVQLGDLVDLRLARARLLGVKKGPDLIADLDKLGQNIDRFSKEDRNKLLNGLAIEHVRQKDLQGAGRLWSELAEKNPNDLELQLKLLDLAFQADNEGEITKAIKQIEKIEGREGWMASYYRARYMVLQAQRMTQRSQQQAKQAKDAKSEADRLSHMKASEQSQESSQALRTSAHLIIRQLMSRRGDWSLIHSLLAQLEEQELELELSQGGPDEKQNQQRRPEKQGRVISSYLRAIELGQRDSNIVRHTVRLLFAAGRGNEALELYNRFSIESQSGDDEVSRMASWKAFRNGDLKRAEEIIREAMVANPGEFKNRLLLVEILRASGHPGEAETELRQAVELAKNDPTRWFTLVKFLTEAKQVEKAEKAVREAETNLSRSAQPMVSVALAECCELVGRAHQADDRADAARRWYGEAKSWFEKARAAQPDDLAITRRFTQFLIQTRQLSEAESQLRAFLDRGSGDKTADETSWARRALALTLITNGDPAQARKALALFEPSNQDGPATKAPEDPEDLRVLARVLDAQKTPEGRRRAIEILNSLVVQNPNNLEDRFLLARFDEDAGDWAKAREQYEELISRTENREDPEILARRPVYLDQFIRGLLRHRQAREARGLVDKLKQLQPNELNTLLVEVMTSQAESQLEKEMALQQSKNPLEKEMALKRARIELDKAATRVRAYASRPNLELANLAVLAGLAESLGEFALAEEIHNRIAAKAPGSRGTIGLAEFLGRRGRIKEALDVCSPLWATTREPELLAAVCANIVLRPGNAADPAELDRVSVWLTDVSKKFPRSTTMSLALANVHERQGRYQQAEELYRRVIEQGDSNGISHNNLAWLLALKNGNVKDALEYVNRAIDLKGPLPDFLDTRGIVYLAKGENERAITDLEKAVAGDPSPSKYFHLAEAYLKANKLADAKKNWEAANIKVWERSGLHDLEQKTYNEVRGALGKP